MHPGLSSIVAPQVSLVVSQEHTTTLQWLWVLIPVAVAVAMLVTAIACGRPGAIGGVGPRAVASRIDDSLHRLTGLPGWCAAGLAVAVWTLQVAVVGFFWDVAWHIDLGRDDQLFTPAHTLILMGVGGVAVSGMVAIAVASLTGAATTWRLGRLRLPAAAVALVVLGTGATIGFPLDDLWHAAYGVDVTMWGPTHLLMIAGASLAPWALWLLVAEAGPGAGRPWFRRHLRPLFPIATVVGLSTLQLEFDDGVPQWQALYQPVLIATATALALVALRVAHGRGWALRGAAEFLLIRGLLALIVGPGLGHVVPHFPIYLGMAVCVELAFELPRLRAPLARALAAGALIGTAGMATEWGFSQVWGREPWQPSLLPMMWVPLLAAVAAAVLGLAAGGVLSGRGRTLPRPAVPLAALALLVALVIPLPRHGAGATVVISSSTVGAPQPAIDRFGHASFLQSARIAVTVSPSGAADGADYFRVMAWQGGGLVIAPLIADGGGRFHTNEVVPTGGAWKTIVLLARGDVVAAAPVSLPADPEYALSAAPLAAERTADLGPASAILLRESHDGAAWPAVVAYTGLGLVALAWLGALGAAFVALGRPREGLTRGSRRDATRAGLPGPPAPAWAGTRRRGAG